MIFSTYPPWVADRSHVEQLKRGQAPENDARVEIGVTPSLGNGANSGGATHRGLLTAAKERLEDHGFQADLLQFAFGVAGHRLSVVAAIGPTHRSTHGGGQSGERPLQPPVHPRQASQRSTVGPRPS